MRKLQNLFAFGALCAAAILFAGCGTAETGGGGSTGGDSGGSTETEGSDSAGGSDTSSTTVTTGDYQLVSLNVPNMT